MVLLCMTEELGDKGTSYCCGSRTRTQIHNCSTINDTQPRLQVSSDRILQSLFFGER